MAASPKRTSLQAARHGLACSAARRTKGESEKRVRSRFPGTTENRGCSNTRSHEGDAMARVMTRLANKPAWVDLASRDAEASRDFYSKLFGWQIEVNPDPQYGGYGRAKVEGRDVGGISPAQDPNQQSAWSLYIGTEDINELTRRVKSAGGAVVAEPFDVGEQG